MRYVDISFYFRLFLMCACRGEPGKKTTMDQECQNNCVVLTDTLTGSRIHVYMYMSMDGTGTSEGKTVYSH